MRTLKLAPFFLYLCFLPAFSEEDHDHDHSHDHGKPGEAAHEDHSSLIRQLGFDLVMVEDQVIGSRSVTALPLTSVFVENGKTFVLAQNEKDHDHLERWEVRLGLSEGQFIEVLSGVFPGDRVISKTGSLATLQKAQSPAPTPVTAPVPPVKSIVKNASSRKSYCIQIGAFTKSDNAKRIATQLEPIYGRSDVRMSQSNGKNLYRVSVGQYDSFKVANESKDKLKSSGFPGAFVTALN